ncbi:hypothetical protein FBU59_001332 [Linderina macrospora]|uniref:Uncharacterized protein n=1 Tax=Linderina macrospora TaxID=4868 RepID=A0ACC1JE99_9FUNG|nr:hypothetical protein FBU59_001332 [Linderina macrospora]
MSAESSIEKNTDKIGGIVVAGVLAISFLLLLWQVVRFRFATLLPALVFSILSAIGWLLSAIGAIRKDTSMNDQGHKVYAASFMFLMAGALALLAKWSAIRSGVSWDHKTSVLAGVAAVLSIVFGSLEAAGSIGWLKNPTDEPKTTIKVGEVGFLVLATIYLGTVVYFAVHEAMVYQAPRVRLSFYITAFLLFVRSLFYMLVALRVIKLDTDKRRLYLFFLTTVPETISCLVWALMFVARDLKATRVEPIGELPPPDADFHPVVVPTHGEETDPYKLDTQPTRDSMFDSAGRQQLNAAGQVQFGNSNAYETPMAQDGPQGFNPWATVSTSSYGAPLSQQQQHQYQHQPLQVTTNQLPQPYGNTSYGTGVQFDQNAGMSYSTAGDAPHHSTFVKTPYPSTHPAPQTSYMPHNAYAAQPPAGQGYFEYQEQHGSQPSTGSGAEYQEQNPQLRRAYQ